MRSPTLLTRFQRIAERAAGNREYVFTTLAHLIDVELLREAFACTKKSSAPGVDGVTGEDYAKDLEANLADLHERLRTRRYRAQPVRRVRIPKEGGKERPIGLPAFEDKLVQRAVVMLLEQVYEQDFYDFSYGFRPERSAHQALRDLRKLCMNAGVGWIVDADIRGFFDNLDRGVLRELLHRRVKDGGIDRLIGKWFHAGVLDGGEVSHPDKGTPQGGVASPLLANIYLHHVLDEWFAEEVRPRLRGRSFLIRFADDFVIGCELEEDARKVLEVLPKRMGRHGLEIHSEKTRLVRFRRPSDDDDDDARPGTFDFLGFTHYWGKTRRGRWVVKHRTAKKRLARAKRAAYEWCRDHRHWSVSDQSKLLAAKLRGHFRYYGVSGNYHAIKCLHHYVLSAWRKWLSTRSSNSYVSWPKMARLLRAYPLPRPRIHLALW